MSDDVNYDLVKEYWKVGFQYLSLSANAADEMVKGGNLHIVISDWGIDNDEYEELTKWSDFNIILPLLFNYYHGLELVLKGFLLAKGIEKSNHKIEGMYQKFEEMYPGNDLSQYFEQYILSGRLPEYLREYFEGSGISVNDYNQAFRYPISTKRKLFLQDFLKYKQQDLLLFLDVLSKNTSLLIREVVSMGDGVRIAMESKAPLSLGENEGGGGEAHVVSSNDEKNETAGFFKRNGGLFSIVYMVLFWVVLGLLDESIKKEFIIISQAIFFGVLFLSFYIKSRSD